MTIGLRASRALAMAGSAAVVMAALGCGGADGDASGPASAAASGAPSAGTPSPATSASASASTTSAPKPEPTDIPGAALLQPTDAGNGWRVDPEGPLGDWGASYTLSICAEAKWAAGRTQLAQASRLIRDDQNAAVLQSVVSYPVADGRARFDEWRSNLKACAATQGTRMTVVRENFAGEESLLIESAAVPDETGSGPRRTVVVRQDGLITEVEPTRHTAGSIVELGKAAAFRLCVVANC